MRLNVVRITITINIVILECYCTFITAVELRTLVTFCSIITNGRLFVQNVTIGSFLYSAQGTGARAVCPVLSLFVAFVGRNSTVSTVLRRGIII